jgi:hypothetical protein
MTEAVYVKGNQMQQQNIAFFILNIAIKNKNCK